jgi:hypothetical protein
MRIPTTLLRIVFGTLLFLPIALVAQHYDHTTIWAKTTVTAPLNERWEVQFEYVHRSQNNFRESSWNPLNHESFEEPRLWFHFRQKHYTVQINPITYIYSEPFLGSEADFSAKNNEEWRSVVGLDVFQKVGKWTFKERFQYEYRWLKSFDYVPKGRMRFRATLQYQLTAKTRLQAFNEVFLNTGPNKFANDFDLNWALAGINHKINDRLSIDLGLMRNYRPRANGIEFDHETALSVALNFKIF